MFAWLIAWLDLFKDPEPAKVHPCSKPFVPVIIERELIGLDLIRSVNQRLER